MKKGAKIALAVGSVIALSTTTPGFLNSDYNKAYAATEQTFHTATSVVDWMKANGLDSSFENRKKLAEQNGIVNYKGTASQNIQLLGNVKEDGVQALHTNTSVVDWLKANGLDSSFNNRKALAEKHGIPNYKGSAAQNIQLLSVFKETGVQNNITTNNQAHTELSIVDWMKANGMNSTFSNRQNLANEYGIANYTGTAEQNLKLLGILNGSIAAPEKGQAKVSTPTSKPVTKPVTKEKEEISKEEKAVGAYPSKPKADGKKSVTKKPVKEETNESKTAPTDEEPVVLPVVKPTEPVEEQPAVIEPTQPATPVVNELVVEEPVKEEIPTTPTEPVEEKPAEEPTEPVETPVQPDEDLTEPTQPEIPVEEPVVQTPVSATSILNASGMTKRGSDEYALTLADTTDVIVRLMEGRVGSIYFNAASYIPWKTATEKELIEVLGENEGKEAYKYGQNQSAIIEKAVRAATDATYGQGTPEADALYHEIIKSEGFSRSFKNDPVVEEPVTPSEPVEETPVETPEQPDEEVTEPTQPEEPVEEPVVQEPVITYENSTSTEAIAFETVEQQDPTLEKGKTVVTQEGQDGVRTITFKETYKDGKFVSKEQVSSEITKAPVNKIVKVGTKEVVPANSILSGTGVFTKAGSSYVLNDAGYGEIIQVSLNGEEVSNIRYNGNAYISLNMSKQDLIDLLGEEEGTKEYNDGQSKRNTIEKAVRAASNAVYGSGSSKANSLYNQIIQSESFNKSF